MPVLPKLSGRSAVKAFGCDGWELARQKGSHLILVKGGSWATLSVPDHRELAPAPFAASSAPLDCPSISF